MKRYLLFLFAAALTLPASAQISKNQNIWTGSLSGKFSRYRQSTIRNPIIGLNAEINAAYFVRDGLAVGLGISGNWSDNTTTIEESQGLELYFRNRSGAVMPFVRKYWKLVPAIVYAGGGIKVSGDKVMNMQQVQYNVIQENRSSAFLVRPQTQLGAILPVSDRLGLDISAQSNLFPISFHSLQLGLIVLSSAKPVRGSTAETSYSNLLSRGRWIASGTFSVGVNKGYNNNSTSEFDYRYPATSVSLSGGAFVQDRLLTGVEVYMGLQSAVLAISKGAVGFASSSTGKPLLLGIRPFMKKYISSARLAPYIQGYLSYDRIMAGSLPTNTYSVGGTVGLAYALNQKLLVEANLIGLSGGYSAVGNIVSEPATLPLSTKYSVDLQAGLQPAFTLTYIFP